MRRKLLPIFAALSALVFLSATALVSVSFFAAVGIRQTQAFFSGLTPLRISERRLFVRSGVLYWHHLASEWQHDDSTALRKTSFRSAGFIHVARIAPTHTGFSWVNRQAVMGGEGVFSRRQISFPVWPLMVGAIVLPARWLVLHRRQRRVKYRGFPVLPKEGKGAA